MKKLGLIIAVIFTIGTAKAADWGNAQWIWQQADGPSNTWMCFRKTLSITDVPTTAEAHIAVDSKYWLWINGEMVVFEGSASRGPSQAGAWDRDKEIMPTNSWYETVNIQPYLKQGENTIAILGWYWGLITYKGTHVDSKKGGMLFYSQIGDQTIVSDDSWKAIQHPAYDNTIPVASKQLVQGNVKFDAQQALNDWTDTAWYTSDFDDAAWAVAVEKGAAGAAPWYNLEENYVPRLTNHGLKDYDNNTALNLPKVVTSQQVISCNLPFNMQVTPYLEVEAEAGKTITVTTDNRLNKIVGTYITKGGTQQFESYSWMNGHQVKYTIPAGVTVKALKYRWMSVGEMAGTYEVDDPFYERLWEMGRNTLFVCARDNFMDCPDRERALWIGDVADQAGYLFYSMDDSGRKLLKKAILQTMYFSQDKVLGALGPARVRELVGQSLQFIAQVVWPYYLNTGDMETLEIAYPYVYDYLALFPMGSNGLPVYRTRQSPDSWDWLDWGQEGTIDKYPMQPAYYYQALVEAKKMAEALGKSEHFNFYNSRMTSIAANYDKVYWKNGFYSSSVNELKDDRANALAITSGLAKPENYKAIVNNVLIPNKFCSPHFEWVVEEAMFMAGYPFASLERMQERYKSQVNSGLSTLYENFPKGGSYNHAWNGCNTVLSKYVAGIRPTGVAWSTYEVCPNLVHMGALKTKVPTVKGDVWVEINHSDSLYKLDLVSPDSTVAIVGIPKERTEILEVKAGGQTIWKDKAFVTGVQGVSFDSEDDHFLRFKVEAGIWQVEADIKRTPVDLDPELSFESPTAGTSLQEGYESLEVKVNATDDVGIQKVELFLNDTLIGAKTEAPFTWSSSSEPRLLGLPLGGYTFKAVVTDTDGKSVEKQVSINVLKKSEGTVIGTPGSFAQSKGDNTTKDAVDAMFDGDISTCFNTSKEYKDMAWGGLDFGENTKKKITKVGFAMRLGSEDMVESHWKKRITGLKFYGANQIDYEGNTIHSVDTAGNLLFVITPAVAASMKYGEIMEANVSSPNAEGYRYGLVFFGSNSYGNAAEIVFTGDLVKVNSIAQNRKADVSFKAHFNESGTLEVDYDLVHSAQVGISVFDLSGRVLSQSPLHQAPMGNNTISITKFNAPQGVYVLSLSIDGVLYTQKVIR